MRPVTTLAFARVVPLLLLVALTGCRRELVHPHGAAPGADHVHGVPVAQAGDAPPAGVLCIVTHKPIPPEHHGNYVDTDGVRVWLCCEPCRKEFLANPRRFLGPGLQAQVPLADRE